MGFADSTATMLFTNRRKSDIEFEIQAILQRKMAILDECNHLSDELAKTIYTPDTNTLISPAAALPGITVPPGTPTANFESGIYETKLKLLQNKEKELDNSQKKLEVELEAVKAEFESMKKIAQDHAKNDYKVGG